MMATKIGLDSNAYSYWVKSMSPAFDPANEDHSLANEIVSMIRIYFYGCNRFQISPTVINEYKKIPNREVLINHEVTEESLLDEILPEDINYGYVKKRTKELQERHKDEKDCTIVAEYEYQMFHIILSNDEELIKKLTLTVSPIRIMKPSDYWEEIKDKGVVEDNISPHPTNPLSKKDWWKINK